MSRSEQREPCSPDFVWWKHGVVYQIYPRSFQDSNADGVGDIEGVIQRLDYLTGLGSMLSGSRPSCLAHGGLRLRRERLPVDRSAVWRYAGLQKVRGLKLILDYIPNHTSDQHLWFRESRSSRANPRRNWFIWRDTGADGGPSFYHAVLALRRREPALWRGAYVRSRPPTRCSPVSGMRRLSACWSSSTFRGAAVC